MKITTIFIAILFLYGLNTTSIKDSSLTFEQSIAGTKAPKSIIDSLEIVNVEYYDADGKLRSGQFVLNIAVAQDVKEAFEILKKTKFPVAKAIPIVEFDWDDNASMNANNSSAFNYRFIAGTERLSHHAAGRAIDINPMQNPVIYGDGKISPKGAKYNPKVPGTFTTDSEVVKFLKSRGWRWGGDWTSLKDYHHFDKP
ncbi:MAG: M15 family metallopeptidase [Desulfobulbaceae bacterium]|nr:M15 family metallopeptidase [Candidatus Kapabacteria bacterium]MBS4000532.1 M15 family metallopeptidase [Desulfobulbaceae bacterium]